MSCGEDEARTYVQDELGSHGLVVADSVFHVAVVAVLGHLEPVALPSRGAGTSTWSLDLPQDTVCPGWLPLLGTAVGKCRLSIRGWGSRHLCLLSLFPVFLIQKTLAHIPTSNPSAELTWYHIC